MHRWIQQTHEEPLKTLTEDVPADPQMLFAEAEQTCAAREPKICRVDY